jgi:hypothetical protein
MRQRDAGFSDLRGATATLELPISERLLNEIVAETLPPSRHIQDVQIQPRAGDRIGVRMTLGSLSFPLPINLTLAIDAQPDLPASPVLVFRLETVALLLLAGPVLRLLGALPPGIRVENDRLYLDLAKLLADRGLASWLEYVEQLTVTTVEGKLVVSIRAGVR